MSDQPKKAVLLAITKLTSSASESTIHSKGNTTPAVSSSVSQSDNFRKATISASQPRSSVIQSSGLSTKVKSVVYPTSVFTSPDAVRKAIISAQTYSSTYQDDTPFDKAVLLDISNKVDLFDRIVSFIRDYADTAQPNDVFAVAMIKPAFDDTQTTDASTILVNKGVEEVVSLEDLFSKIVSFVRLFDDENLLSDQLNFDLGKILADTAQSLSVTAIDSEKPFANSFVLLDQINIQSDKVQADSVSYSSNGRIISQGYVDNNEYFLDDYVGQTVTFT